MEQCFQYILLLIVLGNLLIYLFIFHNNHYQHRLSLLINLFLGGEGANIISIQWSHCASVCLQDLYQKFLDGDDISKIPKEEDPFWEPTEDVMIGSANVFLQSLSYALDFEDKIMVTDYKGQEEGFIVIHVAPCQKDGKPLEEEAFVDNPKELLGKPYHFKVNIIC
ncbi:hypothetical protein DPMN_170950 [Dreissena polymorpha]|uniref:Uncharacterized protein n=1 Tax=Dreissena polymorpha TaxID=45954 RepID=A0A9D4DZE9_DREPO|nr:hypothetical protein DPMN_170950 [Dreissena polymorpha]